MAPYGGKDMARSFRTVRNNTIQIAEEIPEGKYEFRATPETRTVGQTLVHIALQPALQHHLHTNRITDLATFNFPGFIGPLIAEENNPRDKQAIIALLKTNGDTFAAYLEGLPEAFLAETVKMHPGTEPAVKTRLEMLLSPKEHEMHHRGQLMVLQRMIGLKPHLTRQLEQRLAQAAAPQR